MKPLLVVYFQIGFRQKPLFPLLLIRQRSPQVLLSMRSWEAILIYFLPASWALATASPKLSVFLILASLTSIGRLTPAITSIGTLTIIEIARFEGVPPNMSVRTTTPAPSFTFSTLLSISLLHLSISSSGPMQTEAIFFWDPTTCSNALINSSASRPCVTSTRPIISSSFNKSGVPKTFKF